MYSMPLIGPSDGLRHTPRTRQSGSVARWLASAPPMAPVAPAIKAVRCGMPLFHFNVHAGSHRVVTAGHLQSARSSETEVGFESHAGEHAHVEVFAALGVLHE